MYKKYTYSVKSGTEALITSLKLLNSKKVIIPTYTCTDILKAVKQSNCEYLIVDCGLDLQVDISEVINNSKSYDTVIVPHMFGIRANIKAIRDNTNLKIIEDLSQCHGLPNLGKYADIVISSTNKSKWIDKGKGGLIFSDVYFQFLDCVDFLKYIPKIQKDLVRRNELANEIKEAGIQLIGKESSWLRGMYFTESSSREPYIPLHKIEEKFDCPKVNSYIGKVNWLSIII